jgi:ribonuclease T1
VLSALAHRVARLARGAGLAVVLGGSAFALTSVARDVQARAFEQELGTIRAAQLPPEGRATLAAIRAGGPFASRRDGIVFGNRERILPRRPRGYYAEYTVPTPGERTRGARRIIAGRGQTGDFRSSGEYYYTDDHYNSFRRIVQ